MKTIEGSVAKEIDFDGIKARIGAIALEALQEVFHRMPWDQTFGLSNGKTAKIVKLPHEPHAGEHLSYEHLNGFPHVMFDVQFEDGSGHVEFILYQSGWGGTP